MILGVAFTVIPFFSIAQIDFDQILSDDTLDSDIVKLSGSSVSTGDVNGDGSLDLFLTGNSAGVFKRHRDGAYLYLNDGNGLFTEVENTNFRPVRQGGESEFADVDGDQDLDLILTGRVNSVFEVSKLYINDGLGGFAEAPNTPFRGVGDGSIDFSDVDNDGDQDVFITGEDGLDDPYSMLYLNDGNGNFSRDTINQFTHVEFSSAAFGDIDDDGDDDLVFMGSGVGNRVFKVYTNDGNGVFDEFVSQSSIALIGGQVELVDFDNDTDLDILLSGATTDVKFDVLVNDGIGNFSILQDSPFAGARVFDIADINGDSNKEILLSGAYFGEDPRILSFYLNDGQGGYIESEDTPFLPIQGGTSGGDFEFGDFDGDSDQDLIMTSTVGTTELYLNDGFGNFSPQNTTPFMTCFNSSLDMADVDSDGDMDILYSGRDLKFSPFTILYLNEGDDTFIESPDFEVESIYAGDLAIEDVNGDANPDLIISGLDGSGQPIAKVYLNDSQGDFIELSNTALVGSYNSSIDLADIDNDGDLDLFISGNETAGSNNNLSSRLYENDGSGSFLEIQIGAFPGFDDGKVLFEDLDLDGDPDLFLSGYQNFLSQIVRFYTNDGNGNFSLELSTDNAGFVVQNGGDAEFADLNGDLYPELIISSSRAYAEPPTIFFNNEGVSFTISESTIPIIYEASLDFADVDGDLDLDLVMAGEQKFGSQSVTDSLVTKLFINDGTGEFSELEGISFNNTISGEVMFGDLDGDSIPDLFQAGVSRAYINITEVDSDGDGVTNFEDECPINADATLDSCGDCVGGNTGVDPCCASPFPAVDEQSLSTTLNPNTVLLQWAPVAGQIGCQLKIREAENASTTQSVVVSGSGASSFSFSASLLSSGTDYEWQVRCGCSQSPVIAGPFSSWQPFTYENGGQINSQPNPTNGISTVTFKVSQSGTTTLEVFDMHGRLVDAIYSGIAQADQAYTFQFDGSLLPNGIYIYRLTTESNVLNEKFMISR